MDEDLFYGNRAARSTATPLVDPATQSQDQQNEENGQSFCLCDGSHWCGRRAISDTTADDSEPQRNILLGVPKVFVLRRRRKREASDHAEDDGSTGSARTYVTHYKYVRLSCIFYTSK